MKRLKEKIDRILDIEIRNLLGRLSPGKRLAVALTLFGTMFIVFISVVGYGLYRIGHDEAMQQMQRIENIVIPDFGQDPLPEHRQRHLDSIRYNHLNDVCDDPAGE